MGRRTGFTLIEVLGVVAIIATLISILLSSLAQACAQPRVAKCLVHLADLGVAAEVFFPR